jgi:hypothetical protein
MTYKAVKILRDMATKLFEPVRPHLRAEEVFQDAKPDLNGTAEQKAECLEHLEQAWRIHMLLQQQYAPVPLTDMIDRFTRSAIGQLSRDFVWLQQETKVQVLAIVFAAIIRSNAPSETETRDAIKQIWPRLVEEVHWPS